ncbi:hypothetical protein OGAPHI_004056 [Ogataea philodendri]|uniref:Uncharacterized protein n=1 Tax=Ogataea philodendri TaxID=1378263 RepID=A0A9P8P5Z1_9ASCO|nr:uncharacterized protein OGAPHI_004056 [Ogataea philodendri]KAH3665867.1 hypothetical protein OGAPHI_004056 [Ogataea philodendri]
MARKWTQSFHRERKLVLVDQVAESGLAKPQGQRQLGGKVPFKLARTRHHVAKTGRVPGKPQNSVAVHARVFEVDADFGIFGDNQLQLVVPPVGAGSDLNTVFEARLATKEVLGHACEVRADLDVVENHHKQRRVEDLEDF